MPGQYAYANGAQAQRYADLQMQGREASAQQWRGRSTLRTMAAGTDQRYAGTAGITDVAIDATQNVARLNAENYHNAFSFVPWSTTQTIEGVRNGSSIWPVCPKGSSPDNAGELSTQMPFAKEFWENEGATFNRPKKLNGFFTLLPIYWTSNENNHPGEMSVMLLSQISHDNGEQKSA